MDTQKRVETVMKNVEEVVTEDELRELLKEKENPSAYIGFEPSGLMHVAQGVLSSSKIKDLQEAGFTVKIFMADWHAYVNNKLDGDIETIKICGEYFKDAFLALGIDPDKAEFIFASEIMDGMDYWEKVLRVAKNNSVARIRRAVDIMGREKEEAEADSSMLIYPSLQATDIFILDVDLAYAGMDQRRAHMLARDTAEKMGWKKPIALHTPILSGLKGGGRMDSAIEGKMSKSDPESCIFIHDSPEDIENKIHGAYCPQEAQGNPVLQMCRYIIFPEMGELHIPRKEKWGGDLHYESYEELKDDFINNELHPADLKKGVAKSIAELLEPVREYFEENPENYERLKERL